MKSQTLYLIEYDNGAGFDEQRESYIGLFKTYSAAKRFAMRYYTMYNIWNPNCKVAILFGQTGAFDKFKYINEYDGKSWEYVKNKRGHRAIHS